MNYRQQLNVLLRPMWQRVRASDREWRLLNCALTELVGGGDEKICGWVAFGRAMADGINMKWSPAWGGICEVDAKWQRSVAWGCCQEGVFPFLAQKNVMVVAGKGFHREVVSVLKAFAGCECDPLSCDVLGWNDGCVRKVAWAVYQGDSELCVLGDALQDAGYGDVRLLDRVYGGEWSGRGAWVLDWVLGYAPVV